MKFKLVVSIALVALGIASCIFWGIARSQFLSWGQSAPRSIEEAKARFPVCITAAGILNFDFVNDRYPEKYMKEPIDVGALVKALHIRFWLMLGLSAAISVSGVVLLIRTARPQKPIETSPQAS